MGQRIRVGVALLDGFTAIAYVAGASTTQTYAQMGTERNGALIG